MQRELLANKAIEFISVHVFLNVWVEKTHKNCIYTPVQLILWNFNVI